MFTLSEMSLSDVTIWIYYLQGRQEKKHGRHFNEEDKEEMGLRQENKGTLSLFFSSF